MVTNEPSGLRRRGKSSLDIPEKRAAETLSWVTGAEMIKEQNQSFEASSKKYSKSCQITIAPSKQSLNAVQKITNCENERKHSDNLAA